MKVKVIKSVTDDFCNQAGPSTVTNVLFLWAVCCFILGNSTKVPI